MNLLLIEEQSMSKYVLDAAVLLVSLHSKNGYEIVDEFLPECSISTINQSKVIQKAQ
jgi:PIN domain nuclease of toxin-antitoxin system